MASQTVDLSTKEYDLLVFSGETSGDLHGAKLLETLLKKRPNLNMCGVAGPQMREQNIDCLMQTEEFEVMGFTDVFFSLPSLIKKFKKIRNQILSINPKVCIFIDYPGFSIRMEKALRKKGYTGKLIHFICPSVWAWHKKRIDVMATNLDLLLTIFPFEKKCFSHTDLPVEYIGNPLFEYVRNYEYKTDWKKQNNIPADTKVLALFPGSRKQEIEKNLPLQLKVLKKIQEKHPIKIFLSLKQNNFKQRIIYFIHEFFKTEDITIIDGRENYDLMKAADLAIATSGTVTLELALHQVPTIVTYAIKPLDRIIAQKILKIDLPHYCIVNIIENRRIFPELFGPNLTEENLYFWTEHLLSDKKAYSDCKKSCEKLINSLETKKPSEEAAKNILAILTP
jgi:lipid-A-disaccharide synthase